MAHVPVLIIGAGPAGLAAAYELAGRGVRSLVVEKAALVGGIARTETYRGFRFDVGGHRFYTRLEPIQRIWDELLGSELLSVRRMSHIYYQGRFFRYPLELGDALLHLGVGESVRVLASYVRAIARPQPSEDTFEQWVINRFGRRLYEIFFKTYTEKVWGVPCSEIRADWAAQRIRGLTLTSAVSSALLGTDNAKTLIRQFRYPRLGPGQMWEQCCEVLRQRGTEVRLQSEAVRLHSDDHRITSVVLSQGSAQEHVTVDHVISTMPLGELAATLEPWPPADVLRAASGLRYRSFVMVGLILRGANLFSDNWIYVHSPEVRAGRIQNFRNWSEAMVPDPTRTSIGVEYFCDEGDDLWLKPDGELIELASQEVSRLGLASEVDLEDGVVFRQAKAYPLYDPQYSEHVAFIRGYLATVRNLQTIGRSGMHRYNNMDHSMYTGLLAARNILGESHDLWQVNTDSSYGEQV